MRTVVIWFLLVSATVALAEVAEEPWVEEEDLEDPYNEYSEDESFNRNKRNENERYQVPINYEEVTHERRRRETYTEEPFEEHIRVKRKCYNEYEPVRVRLRRSTEYARMPRQVHQYQVHEFIDDRSLPVSLPYEEMLAASAEHYHRVHVAPGAPVAARYLNPDVSAGVPLSLYPVTNHNVPHVAQRQTNVHVKPVSTVESSIFHPLSIKPVPLKAESITLSPNADSVHFPVSGPVPIASIPVSLVNKFDEDQLLAAGHHHQHQKHAHDHAQGGGHQKHGHLHGEHGEKSTKHSKSDHHVDKGNKGYKTDEVHRKEYEEAQGKKKNHHDRAGHKGNHEEEAHGQRGSKFDEKKGHKKGHKTKGFHNKYHKDEFHKEHKFYDDYHKGGEHHRYGKFHAKHASDESGKKKAQHVDAGHDYVERGKKGYSNKGHLDADHKGYKGQDGHDEHSEHHAEHGKKSAHAGGSHWGHSVKH